VISCKKSIDKKAIPKKRERRTPHPQIAMRNSDLSDSKMIASGNNGKKMAPPSAEVSAGWLEV
jgi:hypothetical protein